MRTALRELAQRGVDIHTVLDDMRFLTTEKLGDKQSLTPEGFLLIEDVPIARTGVQIYAPQEVHGKDGALYKDFAAPPDGVYRVQRDESEVFAPDTIASVNGKPLVDEHPEQIVTPDTHEGVPGVVMNARRGTGLHDDLLVADVVVYNKKLIQLIRDGKRELSCGYDVDYEELGPGRLAQRHIIVNHIALVDSGRCGPRCAIGDRDHQPQPTAEEISMAPRRNKPVSVFDRIRAKLMSSALPAADKEELEKALKEGEAEDEGGEPGHHIELHNHMPAAAEARGGDPEHDDGPDGGDVDARIARLETAVHELAEMCQQAVAGSVTSDEEKKADADWKKKIEDAVTKLTPESVAGETPEAILGELELEAPTGAEVADVRAAKDSRYLGDSFQHAAAFAEILAPGIRLPAFDSASKPAVTLKSITELRRSALDFAYRQPDTHGMIEEVTGGRAFDAKTAKLDVLRSTFAAVGAMKRNVNNRQVRVGDSTTLETRAHGAPVGKVDSLTAYQKMLNEHYAKSA